MEASVVSRSDLGADSLERLDPEFVQKSFLEREVALGKLKPKRLTAAGELNPGPKLGAMADDAEFTYVDLDSVQPLDGLVLPDVLPYAERPSRAQHVLKEGDVLIANVRPNRGTVAMATARLEGAVASSGFSVLRCAQPDRTDFTFLFLRTEWGRAQLVRRSRGSMYPAVLPRDVEELLIPTPTDELTRTASSLMDACRASWDEFFANHESAQALLAEVYGDLAAPPGLHESLRDGVDSNVVQFGDCMGPGSPGRIDAEYFRAEYDTFRLAAEQKGAVPLGKLVTLQQGRAKSGSAMTPTFRQGSLTNYGINWSAVGLEPGSPGPATAVKQGDVLLAAMAHEARYLGRKADYVRDLPDDVALNNQAVHHLMVLRLRAEARGQVSGSYIAAVLRSPLGMHQVQRCNRGVRGDHVGPDDLATQVLIPLPSPEWLTRFDAAVELAETARNRAETQVARGVAMVDDWISSTA